MTNDRPGTGIDASVPHSARIWNYWLGGKDNYEVDRAAGEAYLEVYPAIRDDARAQRAYLARTIRFLAGEAGIRQFLDIGTGLPTADNTHEVAQRVAPESRIVYVDNDPLVLAHARALLTSTPQGQTAYIDADLRDIGKIISEASRTLDFAKPVALIMHGILGHVPDTGEAQAIVRELTGHLASGSYVDIADGGSYGAKEFNQAQEGYNETGAVPYILRTPDEIASLFNGLDLVEPGVVSCPRWRPEDTAAKPPDEAGVFGGVAEIP